MMDGPVARRHSVDQKQVSLPGRQRELATLQECLIHACAGNGGLVLVSGEAGIGKTTLVRAIADGVARNGAMTHASACYDLTVTPPYGPWTQIFRDILQDDSPLPLPAAEPSGSATSHDALFAEVMDLLSTASAEQPRVLVLDDLHWADSASLELLRYVARRLENLPALVVVTYRDNEIGPDHPLQTTLAALVRESEAARIPLRPLDDSSVAEIIDQRYNLAPGDRMRLISYIQQRAEGNPFFIGELLLTLEESGTLHETGHHWSVGNLRQMPLPALVRQVIDGRLNELDRDNRHLLAIGATIGEHVSLDVWSQASGASEAEITEAVRNALALNILEETDSLARMRFTHALIRETLYHDLGPSERRNLHRVLGEIQERLPAPEPDAVAFHYQQADDPRAIDWLMRAGERAQQMYAWRTAAERFLSVLKLIEGDDSHTRTRGWLSYRIGLLLTYADPENGIEQMRHAERIAEAVNDPGLVARARADRGLLHCLLGDVRQGLTELQSGVDELECLVERDGDDPVHPGAEPDLLSPDIVRRGALQLSSAADEINVREGSLVFWLSWAGRYREAIAIGERFVEQATTANIGDIQDALGDALAGLGHAYAALGRPDEALNAFGRARDAYRAIDHHFKVGNTAIYELSEAFLPYRADRIMQREWLADEAEAG